MTSASWALQQAVFATLCAAGDVHALAGNRIFDAVPRNAAFPYIVVGEAAETPNNSADGSLSEHKLQVHIWSRGGGHREIKQLAEAVREALDGASLVLSGHCLIDLAFASAGYQRESDGETYRATLGFRAVTEPSE
jgi:hypothetical protein